MNIHIINLAASTERRMFQQRQLQRLNLDAAQFFRAISVDDIDEATCRKHHYDWQRPLRKGEIACYFSHRELWRKIAADDNPALILEDDVLLSKHITALLAELEDQPQCDLINLENCTRKKYLSRQSIALANKPHRLYRLHLDRSGAGAYILYPGGAKKLLAHEKNGIALADAYIHRCRSLNAFQIEPTPAVQMMFAEHYGIRAAVDDIPQTHIDRTTATKSDLRLVTKRILGELQLAGYKIAIQHKAVKRHLRLDANHFS